MECDSRFGQLWIPSRRRWIVVLSYYAYLAQGNLSVVVDAVEETETESRKDRYPGIF
jgi:hypothetical protein